MSLSLDPRTTALVLIDLQKGIMGMPTAPYPTAQVVEKAASLARRLKEAGGTVVLVHVGFAGNSADRLKQPVDTSMSGPPGGWPADFAEFVPEIASLQPDVVITKRHWGAFHGTELDLQLRRRGITTIILGGVATNFGVESTAREAWQNNYAIILAEDICSSVSAEMHQFSIDKILPRLARVRSSKEIEAALGG